MLLPRELPARYQEWNRSWGAPEGRALGRVLPRRLRALPGLAELTGVFGFQPNSDTRRFEYPWAHEVLDLRPPMRVLEIGGSNSGLQFVLDRAGCQVVNVDPGQKARGRGWPVSAEFTARLNRRFGTRVELRNCFIEQAGLEEGGFDRAVSISTLEHIPAIEIPGVLRHVARALKPGGRLVLTVDLFLDLAPFTERTENQWGTNVPIRWLVEESGLELVIGRPDQLYGFEEFDPLALRRHAQQFCIGTSWPVMVQALVLQKRGPNDDRANVH